MADRLNLTRVGTAIDRRLSKTRAKNYSILIMTISSVVSTFEVLVKRLIPPSVDILGAGRTVIQGYFLTISNLNLSSAVTLRLNFRAQTPNITSQALLAFFDVNGTNTVLAPTGTPITQTYTVTIPAGDTGLFILQANVGNPNLINNPNIELRGYVTISLANPFGNKSFDLLVTPEHRGTFLPKGYVVPATPPIVTTLDFDQLAYALPTANPGNKFNLSQVNFAFSKAILSTPNLSELAMLDPDLLDVVQKTPDVFLVSPEFPNISPNIAVFEGRDTLAIGSTLQRAMFDLVGRLETLMAPIK